MMELLSPAGSPEAVIAAVQNGADAVYLGFGDFNARRSAHNFTPDEFEKAVRYCRLRNCKVYVTLNTLVNDREMTAAVNAARMASEKGADAILVQDFGLAKVLRRTVPDIPLHASTQMSIHNLAGAEAAAQLGMTRIVLARELSLEEIRFISKHCSAETEVFVHGALCFCHSGQCYMSAMIGRRSGNRGMCAQPCRMQYSLGGRMDDYPLSLKDNCLANRLQALEEAGVACVKIEGRMKRPEYTGIVTGVYSKLLKEKRNPTPDEMELLARTFSRQGFTQGYLDGDKSDMFGIKAEPDEEIDSLYADARKAYSTGEVRRVPIHFYSLVEKGERAKAIAFDDNGNRAAAFGPVPERAKRQGVTANYIIEQMYKTGGTPFTVVENQAKADEGLFLPAAEINELRRKLISELSEKRMTPPQRRSFAMPVAPEDRGRRGEPEAIFQITTAEQLTPELAALKPHFLYAPAAVMAENYSSVLPFLTGGTTPVAVLPRVITDDETEEIFSTLEKLHEYGVNQALIGNIGHVALAKQAGMEVRGDFGLNAFNSQTLDVLRAAGFLSATASFELRIQQIRDMQKPLDTEMIIYGRLPVMVSDQCIIRQSSGRCNCQVPGQLADRTGSVFPVMKEFGCRNVIYNAHKLFLADRRDELLSAGLWGMRLLFTTESARECVEVAKAYLGMTDYQPNMLTRGLYYRGVE
ncbi:MAG: U32 family peptidase [Oscillospiraceae bacterium]|nr:U32 family peptidase [Oscillospiraceae bacterium]MBR3175424.1 U32 family peptidase [Oscillospiraceae bacterium]